MVFEQVIERGALVLGFQVFEFGRGQKPSYLGFLWLSFPTLSKRSFFVKEQRYGGVARLGFAFSASTFLLYVPSGFDSLFTDTFRGPLTRPSFSATFAFKLGSPLRPPPTFPPLLPLFSSPLLPPPPPVNSAVPWVSAPHQASAAFPAMDNLPDGAPLDPNVLRFGVTSLTSGFARCLLSTPKFCSGSN